MTAVQPIDDIEMGNSLLFEIDAALVQIDIASSIDQTELQERCSEKVAAAPFVFSF